MDHYNMLRRVSRTFALSIELLPYVLRESMTLSYLLLRVADCLEDHADIPEDQKPDLLKLWAGVLDGSESTERLTREIAYLNPENDPEVQAALQAGHYLNLLNDSTPYTFCSLTAMRKVAAHARQVANLYKNPSASDQIDMEINGDRYIQLMRTATLQINNALSEMLLELNTKERLFNQAKTTEQKRIVLQQLKCNK